ncbi:DUF305 domain-containing protein [Microbispora sp. H10670]|uniref:DUF305 domain-containing protein n=1 Tax=Microbispora sp. H10670 TaxID=2729108 RepID=UPI001604391F|nr:DUF305 domain-containing protein [Microbispora sp. H10670]
MTTAPRRPLPVNPGLTGTMTAVLAMVLLAGCGGADGASPSPAPAPASAAAAVPSNDATVTATPAEPGATDAPADHNAADVAFAGRIIPHHLQAVDLATLAQSRAGDPWVRDMASRILSARDTDIRTLKGWLDMWGAEPLPRDHKMPGMQTRAEIDALAKLSGPAFDKRFTTLMIKHDGGAIAIAGVEQKKGAFDGGKALATAISTALSAEVKELKEYLAKLK